MARTYTKLAGTVAMVAALALALPAAAQEGLNGEEDESWLDTGPVFVVEIGPSAGCTPWESVVADGGYFLPGAAAARTPDGTEGADFIQGGKGDDFVSTLAGNDTVLGSGGADTVISEGGADLLFGNDGDDGLFGGEDADTLVGGKGDDMLSAGAGADLFVVGEGLDTVIDFDGAEGQRIAIPASAAEGFTCAADFAAAKMTLGEDGVKVDLGVGASVLLPEPKNISDAVFVLIAE